MFEQRLDGLNYGFIIENISYKIWHLYTGLSIG